MNLQARRSELNLRSRSKGRSVSAGCPFQAIPRTRDWSRFFSFSVDKTVGCCDNGHLLLFLGRPSCTAKGTGTTEASTCWGAELVVAVLRRQTPIDLLRANGRARHGRRAQVALALVAVVSALVAIAVVSQGSTRLAVPGFLSQQLGAPRHSPFVSKDRISTVRIAGGGFSVGTRKGTVALNLALRGAGPWTSFAHGAARNTRVGVETITRSVAGAEDFLAVLDHHGTRTWRWSLDTPGLEPALLPNGEIAFRIPGAQWAGMWIPKPHIFDHSGREVSPRGLRWTLDKAHVGGAVLALRLNDRKLPTPYIVDPGVTFVAAGVVQASASATSLSITGPAGLSAGDIEVAFVTAKNNVAIPAPDASWNSVTSGQGGSAAGQTRNGTGIQTAIFWHKATGVTDVGPFSFGFTGSAVAMAGDIVAFTGADQNAPVDLGPTTLFAGSVLNVTGTTAFNSATPTTALSNDMFLLFYGTSVGNLLGITPQASTPSDTEDFDSNGLITTSVEAEGGHAGTVSAGTTAAFSAKNPSTATWISNVVPLVPPLSAQGSGTMALTSIDGSGGASRVSASSTGHTFVFTYTAASGGINRGSVTVAIPSGWTQPSTSSAGNGYSTASKGTLGVSGQTITVSNLMLDGGATLTITYGDKSGTGSGATIGSGTGSQTFTTQETSYGSGSLTLIGAFPSVTVHAADGSGTMALTSLDGGGGTHVSGSSTGHTLVFTYTAAAGGIGGGKVDLIVPAGWSAPSTTNTVNGYSTSSAGTLSVSGQTISVTALTLAGGASFTITYGDKNAGSNNGATAGSTTGSVSFSTKENSTGGATVALGASPSLTVNAADGSGTLSSDTSNVSAGSAGNTITFTYTAAAGGTGNGTVSVDVPTGWDAPSTTASNPGAVSTDAGTIGVAGRTITVTALNLARRAGVHIKSAARAGGPRATSPATTGAESWTGKENSTGGTTVALGVSPSVTVNAANGSGTMSSDTSNVSAGSAGNTITFTYTAALRGMSNGTVSVDVPTGWSAPSTTASNP